MGGAMVFLAMIAACAVGCGGAAPAPVDEARVGSDFVGQAACVENARTRAEADACRCAVRGGFDPCDAGAAFDAAPALVDAGSDAR